MNDTMEGYLSKTVGAIEANAFEEMCIWQTWHKEHKYSWVEKDGWLSTIGSLGKRPICISAHFVEIKGKIVMFWHATSQLVDYVMIDEWLKKNLSEGCEKTDAMNDHIVMLQL